MKLIFVYNANSGLVNTWIDIAHKIVSPSTYSCDLCALTHDTFHERQEWKQFRENSNIDFTFLHKDEFEQQYKQLFSYPIILKEEDRLFPFIEANEFKSLANYKDLIELINQKLGIKTAPKP